MRRALKNDSQDLKFLTEAKKARLDIQHVSGEATERIVQGLFKIEPAFMARMKQVLVGSSALPPTRLAFARSHVRLLLWTEEIVVEDLMLERQQIEAYTALVREIGDEDLVTRQTLIGILAEAEKHASELADYLKRTADTK